MAVTTNYGAAPTYVKIASQTVASASSTVTFSNIPQGYTDLIIFANPIATAGNYDFAVRYNEDSGSNYSWTAIAFNSDNSASPYASRGSNTTSIATNTNIATVNPYPINFQIQNYSNSTTYKSSISKIARETYATSITTGIWRNTAPITSVTFVLTGGGSTTFKAGASFNLYGIKAALFPKATGGDVIVQNGQYWYHAFRSTGAFVPNLTLSCDALVIAGGGSGGTAYGNQAGGGGGAGGYQLFTSQSISTAQTVTVGAGGAGVGTSTLSAGSNGSNSQFGSLTASVGGGRGGSYSTAPGIGGSGGGGGNQGSNRTGAAATSGQGFAGGTGNVSHNLGAGGGGGAGAVGSDGSTVNGGNGGAGKTTEASWLYATGTGVSGYIAGGGGGTKGADGSVNGTGGSGGGGAGNSNADGFYGTVNTGSGGGGAYGDVPYYTSGVGGSGIVIVRYPI